MSQLYIFRAGDRDDSDGDRVRRAVDRWNAHKSDDVYGTFSSAWANDGYCTLEPASPTFASRLAFTDTGALLSEQIEPPARGILFRLPEHVCGVSRIELWMPPPFEGRPDSELQFWCGGKTYGLIIPKRFGTEMSLLSDDMDVAYDEDEDGRPYVRGGEDFTMVRPQAEDVRLMSVVRRICAGLLLSYLVPSMHAKRGLALSAHKRLMRDPPKHRVAVLGRPAGPGDVDLVRAVREYISYGRRTSPTFQYVVRGHWRNQAHGPGHTLRRLQWIEPYWKGPEKAIILARSHLIGERNGVH